jgi:hypothetical protein
MTATFTPFDSALRDEALGNINYESDSFAWVLLTSDATPAKSWSKRSDVTNEVSTSGTNYTSLKSSTISVGAVDGTNHRVDITAGGTTYSSASFTARYAVLCKTRGGLASADELVGWVDFGLDVTSTNDTWTLPAQTYRKSN